MCCNSNFLVSDHNAQNKTQKIDNEIDGHERVHPTNSSHDHVEVEDSHRAQGSSLLNGFYGILLIVLCVIFASPILLLPQHNVITSPQYWYEGIITGCLSFVLSLTLDTLIALKFYFKIGDIISIRLFLYLYIAASIAAVIPYTLSYLIWSTILGFYPPMPFILLLGYIQFLVQYLTLYFLFPKHLATEQEFQKKVLAFIFSRFMVMFVDMQYTICTFLFTSLDLKLQWILAFLLPCLREFNFQIMNKIMIEFPGLDDDDVSAAIVVGMNTFHAMYVAVKIGHTATQITSYLILAIDFILNLYSCHGILALHRSILPRNLTNNSLTVREINRRLLKLSLIEILEVIIPISYIATVLIAYYGPNAELLGNIRSDYWQYTPIEDIGNVVSAVLSMFAIDMCSAIIAGIALYKICYINFLRQACAAMKKYWPVIAVNLANYINYVSIRKNQLLIIYYYRSF